jgi:hypothetical protein
LHFNFLNIPDLIADEDDDIDENEENIENRQLGQINPQILENKYNFHPVETTRMEIERIQIDQNRGRRSLVNLDKSSNIVDETSGNILIEQNDSQLIINKPRQQQTNHSFNDKILSRRADLHEHQNQGNSLQHSVISHNIQSNVGSFLHFIPGLGSKPTGTQADPLPKSLALAA